MFRFEGEFMIMEPVKDPEQIDKLREQYIIPPLKEYLKIMEEVYNKKQK